MQNMDNSFLYRHPKWNQKWEKNENGLTVLLIPKFGDHLIGRWFMSNLKRPYVHLKLDEIGSFVWEHCNGSVTVEEIGNKLKTKFGNKVEPVFERLALFFQSLEKSKSITWR